MRRHGDLFDRYERPPTGEVLLFQDGPFTDFSFVDGYHYGKLATGPHEGRWVRLGASPVEMGLVRA